jgi:hypothetical protein
LLDVDPSQEGHTDIVKIFLTDSRVDVNIQNEVKLGYNSKTNCLNYWVFLKDGYTALMLAANNSHTEIVDTFLADSKMAVNRQNEVRLSYYSISNIGGESYIFREFYNRREIRPLVYLLTWVRRRQLRCSWLIAARIE